MVRPLVFNLAMIWKQVLSVAVDSNPMDVLSQRVTSQMFLSMIKLLLLLLLLAPLLSRATIRFLESQRLVKVWIPISITRISNAWSLLPACPCLLEVTPTRAKRPIMPAFFDKPTNIIRATKSR